MNEQLVKLKTSINNDVISKFDLQVLEDLRFVPIDIQNNTLFQPSPLSFFTIFYFLKWRS